MQPRRRPPVRLGRAALRSRPRALSCFANASREADQPSQHDMTSVVMETERDWGRRRVVRDKGRGWEGRARGGTAAREGVRVGTQEKGQEKKRQFF